MNLRLVRHGEIPSNIRKIYAGRSAEKLTAKGREQALQTAQKLTNVEVSALYSSPVERAIQTAGIIGDVIGMKYEIDNSFRELEMGPWEGLSEAEVASRYPQEWKIWNTRPAELKLQGRETLNRLLERVLEGVRRIHAVGGERTSVVVTHVAVIRVLLLWHAGESLNLYKTIHVPNAAVFDLEIDDLP